MRSRARASLSSSRDIHVPTRIKICGITRVEDAIVACEAGADAIGLVFHPPSPRNVDTAAARAIVHAVPAFVTTVAVFVDPREEDVRRLLDQVPIDLLQFHGDETAQFCGRFGRRFVKAMRVRPGIDLLEYARAFEGACALLLDAYVSGIHGGTGTSFDWRSVPPQLPLPAILSGGLDAGNVAGAVRQVRPWGVDVSSGVEAAKGIKDPQRIRAFIAGVRDADA